jgi:hypothetical protein
MRSSRRRLTVAHARLADGHRADAGHDLARGQVPVADHPPTTRRCFQIGMLGEKIGDLRLDGLREQRPRSVAQSRSRRITPCWRSGGVSHGPAADSGLLVSQSAVLM